MEWIKYIWHSKSWEKYGRNKCINKSGCKRLDKYRDKQRIQSHFPGLTAGYRLVQWDEEMELVLYEYLRNFRNYFCSTIVAKENIIYKWNGFADYSNHAKGFLSVNVQEQLAGVFDTVLNTSVIMRNLLQIKTFDEGLFYHSVNVAYLSTLIGSYFYSKSSETGRSFNRRIVS